jgi:hypothetical protein
MMSFDFDLIKALVSDSVMVEFNGDVYHANDLAAETGRLRERDIILMAKDEECPAIRIVSHNEAAGRLSREWH